MRMSGVSVMVYWERWCAWPLQRRGLSGTLLW
ncbi:hypothetical protein U0070_004012 [Myodes glareolus]|uniref:Uncharacterized protein n=1 Tax=Myodes glareolus TaxID=447135 RepID=A0AAW0KBD2_MYOGA